MAFAVIEHDLGKYIGQHWTCINRPVVIINGFLVVITLYRNSIMALLNPVSFFSLSCSTKIHLKIVDWE